jgi:hypothetical protein
LPGGFGAIVLVVQLARLSVFMIDPTAASWSVIPWNEFSVRHACMSGYWAAGREIVEHPTVWNDALTSSPGPTPTAPRVPRRLGPLSMDTYEYPPTFLVLPRAIMRVVPDFFAFRQVWFALNLGVVAFALVIIGRRLAPAVGPAALWFAPLVLVPLSVMVTFQIGNVQLACIAVSVLAMLCFEQAPGRGRGSLAIGALGGVLLAYMTVSKLYPGLLVVYLLVRRDWRAVAWTSAFAAAFALLGLADMGLPPHVAFLDHLPRLLSGESFPNLRNPRGIPANMSVPGIVLKLGLYGIAGLSFGAVKVVGWINTVAVIGVIAWLARRPLAPAFEPIAWIAIVLLATLRSPVLPVYGIFPEVWLLLIVLAARWRDAGMRSVAIGLFMLLAGITPSQGLWRPAVHAVFSFVFQTLGSFAIIAAALHLGRPSQAASSPAAI